MSALRAALAVTLACSWPLSAAAQSEAGDALQAGDDGAFSFAVVATDTGVDDRQTATLLHAIGDTPVRFVVHFDRTPPSPTSCADAQLDRRRSLLDASPKPVVPVVGTTSWAECGLPGVDPFERLQRVDDLLFGSDQSLGQNPMPWLRQSAVARFHRYRENLRWQAGRVLFATLNLPDNNNAFRFGAGRNGEFEDRSVANRAWLDRTFRLAKERRLAGVVLFIDASPRFTVPLRPPDLRARDRDGYYEWKLALREALASYKGRVLLVQNRHTQPGPRADAVDRPLRDAAGHPIDHLSRVAAPDGDGGPRWLRIDVDPASAQVFKIATERVFDDPSGELYGEPRVR